MSPHENTKDFADYIGKKHNIEVFKHVVKYKGPEHKQWMEFLDGISG